MKTYRPSRACALALLIVVAAPGIVAAQPARPGQGKPERQRLRTDAKVKAVRANFMQVVVGDDQVWVLRVDAKPDSITLTGTAEPSWLRPGMPVRLTARLNKRRQAVEPITEISVITPREGYRMGIFPEEGLGAGGFGFEEDGEKRPAAAGITCLVNGRLTGFKNGEIAVAAGGAPVRGKLAEEATIKVDVADISFARPGDKVHVEGFYFQKGQAIVTLVEIEAAEPFTGPEPKKKPAPRRPLRQEPKPLDNPDEDGEPEEGDEDGDGQVEPEEGDEDGDGEH